MKFVIANLDFLLIWSRILDFSKQTKWYCYTLARSLLLLLTLFCLTDAPFICCRFTGTLSHWIETLTTNQVPTHHVDLGAEEQKGQAGD